MVRIRAIVAKVRFRHRKIDATGLDQGLKVMTALAL